MIKQLLLACSLLLFPALVMLPTQPVLAQFDTACRDNSSATLCQEVQSTENPLTGPNGTLLKVVDVILVILGFAAVIMVIIGGIKFITSSGDPSNVTSARNTILYAIIGVVVAVIARPLLGFIIRSL